MIRADLLLVERQIAASRTAAQNLIDQQRVVLIEHDQRRTISKPSQKVFIDCDIEIIPDEADRYVSRGGLKMQGALTAAGLDVTNMVVLDVGISTGGFTDCLLQAGASRVIGVDVGHSQLAPRLAADQRVVLLENINARHLSSDAVLAHTQQRPVDLIVVDVSFISLTLVLPAATRCLAEGGYVLALVKPQFEVGKEGLGKGGIVKNASLYDGVREKIIQHCQQLGLTILAYFDSPITGGDGNREFFVFASRPL
nr:TlyA family RNA methyltransferase [Chitinivorax tropicus]